MAIPVNHNQRWQKGCADFKALIFIDQNDQNTDHIDEEHDKILKSHEIQDGFYHRIQFQLEIDVA